MHLCCIFSAAYTLSTKGVPQQSQSEPAKGSPLREKKGRMSENSWRGNLGRTGGFYQDADWYSANLRRKVTQTWQSNQLYFPYLVQMPLVGKMMEELVAALPPLGSSKVRLSSSYHRKVLDLLAGAGQATIAVLGAYPRWVI